MGGQGGETLTSSLVLAYPNTICRQNKHQGHTMSTGNQLELAIFNVLSINIFCVNTNILLFHIYSMYCIHILQEERKDYVIITACHNILNDRSCLGLIRVKTHQLFFSFLCSSDFLKTQYDGCRLMPSGALV